MSITDTPTTPTTPVSTYAALVRESLADLPPDARDDLLDGLEEHLAEVAADGEGSLAARLGPPAAYAQELRAAAGLGPVPAPGRLSLARRWTAASQAPAVAAALAFWRSLRPGWWVLRGLLATAWVLRHHRLAWHGPLHSSTLLGLGVAVACVAVSVAVGLRWRPRTQVAVALTVGANLVVLVAGVRAGADQLHRSYSFAAPYTVYNTSSETLTGPQGIVYNIYPYDAEGRPLTDVRLFDQAGNPLDVRVGRDANGATLQAVLPKAKDLTPLANVFPQQQIVTDGVTGAAAPSAAPTLSPGPLTDPNPRPGAVAHTPQP